VSREGLDRHPIGNVLFLRGHSGGGRQ
jgi:hypothetical protein